MKAKDEHILWQDVDCIACVYFEWSVVKCLR